MVVNGNQENSIESSIRHFEVKSRWEAKPSMQLFSISNVDAADTTFTRYSPTLYLVDSASSKCFRPAPNRFSRWPDS